ncbi:MAG: hypothetical protein M3268_07540 [Acidobacteriota bacterium]|nr:hypothetical protein [Acidobacteriota bacterium]
MRSKLLLVLLAIVTCAAAAGAWSKYARPSNSAHNHQAADASADTAQGAPGEMDMGPHMRMTAARALRPGDEERAGEIAARARRAVEKYRDYRAALRDGYEILAPEVPQSMYHFNNAAYFAEAERRFNVEHPTSLLYEKGGGGYRLIGVMYTAPASLSEDELDGRIPLSVAAWHQHVNVCLEQGDPLETMFSGAPRFGLEGSISAGSECREAGGEFYPRLFGWMVHLYPYERTPRAMWSVERQAEGGAHHEH